MKLYFYGHEMVSQSVYPSVEYTEGLPGVVSQMKAMMDRQQFDGLSAPQVGILMQLVVVRLKDGSLIDLVNPRIVGMRGSENDFPERCISVPPYENRCNVARMQTIEVTAASVNDLDNISRLTFKGHDARIIQHELDHLQGTFFFERASIKDRSMVLHRHKAWRHQFKIEQQSKGK